jgi:hypothetical protein
LFYYGGGEVFKVSFVLLSEVALGVGEDHEVVEEFVDDFVVFWAVEVDVSVRCYGKVTVYTISVD